MEIEVVPILRVADADAAVRWYERLGLTKQWEHRFDPDCPAFVSIARGGARLFLSEHRGVNSNFATWTVTGCGSAKRQAERT
jgi:hypothetical protein